MASHFTASVDRSTWRIRLADAGAAKIGHHGFFRDQFRDTLWPQALAWLDGAAVPVGCNSEAYCTVFWTNPPTVQYGYRRLHPATYSYARRADARRRGVAPVVGIPGQELRAEAADVRRAHLHHGAADLVLEDVERAYGAGDAACGRAIERRTADEHVLGAQAERDHRVRAAPDAAVEHHGELVAGRRGDGRQHLDRRRATCRAGGRRGSTP